MEPGRISARYLFVRVIDPTPGEPARGNRRLSMGELVDKIKGNVNEAIGKAKQHSSDPETQAKGAAQELKGKGQQIAGSVKGALGNKI